MAMTREDLRGRVQTVRGVIEPEALGPTLMHEHLICDIRPPALKACDCHFEPITLENLWAVHYGECAHGPKYQLDMPEVIVDEVARMRADGGSTIVELSNGGLSPDPMQLRAISERTDVHVVMGCGQYVEEYQDSGNHARGVEDFAAEMVEQVLDGAWSTEVRAGIIGEIGCQAPWTELERRVMRGAILAQAHTGATINVHPGRDPDQPGEVAEFIVAEGGDPSRTVISHVDRTVFDDDRLLRIADLGCVVELDLFGLEASYYPPDLRVDLPNDAMRLKIIRTLIDHGHLERVVISHDICYRTRLTRFGGHGYGHIFRNVLPLMRRRDFDEAEIEAIMVGNPRRLLSFG
jgi:phosphotriesterase-related protein